MLTKETDKWGLLSAEIYKVIYSKLPVMMDGCSVEYRAREFGNQAYLLEKLMDEAREALNEGGYEEMDRLYGGLLDECLRELEDRDARDFAINALKLLAGLATTWTGDMLIIGITDLVYKSYQDDVVLPTAEELGLYKVLEELEVAKVNKKK